MIAEPAQNKKKGHTAKLDPSKNGPNDISIDGGDISVYPVLVV
jgi:hypothetical protein